MQARWQAVLAKEHDESATKYSRSFTGCARCKRMKVKCDEKRPSCTRCAKRSQPCVYFQKITVFDPNEPKTGPSKAKGARLPDHASDSPPRRPKRLSLDDTRQLLHTACLDQTYAHFFGSKPSTAYYRTARWLPMVIALPDKSASLSLSLAALAFSRLAWLHQDPNLVAESNLYYHKALVSLQKELWQPQHVFNERTLASLHLLSVYEGVAGSSLTSVTAHVSGMASYLCHYRPRHSKPAVSELTRLILLDSLNNHLGKQHSLGRASPEMLRQVLKELLPRKSGDVDQQTIQLGMRRGAVGIRVLIQSLTWTAYPPTELTPLVEEQLDDLQADMIESLRCTELACALNSDDAGGAVAASIDYYSRTMSESMVAERLVDMINRQGLARCGYRIRPEVLEIASPEHQARKAARLRTLWPLLKDDSALSMWHGHTLLKSLIWPGRGGIDDENGHLDVSACTGIRAAQKLDNTYRMHLWANGSKWDPDSWNRAANVQQLFADLWDEDCIAEAETMLASRPAG